MMSTFNARVTPLPLQVENTHVTCTKERVAKYTLGALFAAGGTFLIGLGVYSYTTSRNTQQQTIGAGLIVGGALCFTALCVVVICFPTTGLIEQVNRLGTVVTQAAAENQRLSNINDQLNTSLTRITTLIESEKAENKRILEQISGLSANIAAANNLVKDEKAASQQEEAKVKQLQKISESLLAMIQGMDKEDEQLKQVVASYKSLIAASHQAGNGELAQTTEKLNAFADSYFKRLDERQLTLQAFNQKVTELKETEKGLLTKTEALQKEYDETAAKYLKMQQDLARINAEARKQIEQLKKNPQYTLTYEPGFLLEYS